MCQILGVKYNLFVLSKLSFKLPRCIRVPFLGKLPNNTIELITELSVKKIIMKVPGEMLQAAVCAM